jgi:TatD DNase family protein
MWTDTHCHLDPTYYDGDAGVDAAVQRARDAGVTRMITIGAVFGLEGLARARAVAERHDDVWFTAGLHPHEAADWSPAYEAAMRDAASHPRCVGFGEMGLDFYYDHADRDVQRATFRAQVRLARELGMPVIIHDRDSAGETLAILDEEGAFEGRVLFHCFSGTAAEGAEIAARGGYISIPGIVTFKKAGEMPEVAAAVPGDRLLVETDSPYLAPVPRRGRRNEPAYVAFTGARVAELRGVTPEALARATSVNAARFYGLAQPMLSGATPG